MQPQPKQFEYEIGGKKYSQRKLVLGQLRQLGQVLTGIRLPQPVTQEAVALALADRVNEALAVVLIPEGQEPRDKDNAQIAAELDWSIEAEQTLEVIRDFFACNPISGCKPLVAQITTSLAGIVETPSIETSPGSPKATPSGGGKLSGAARPKTSGPTPTGT